MVVDRAFQLLLADLVAEPSQQLPQLGPGEQEQQHQHVGLFGQLVAVGAVASASSTRSSRAMSPYRSR